MRLPSIVALVLLLSAGSSLGQAAKAPPKKPAAKPSAPLSAESKKCVSCHERSTPGIVAQWRGSRHAREGVGCFECHSASEKEPGSFAHEG
jgi:hydroxylamine dehydrogenase